MVKNQKVKGTQLVLILFVLVLIINMQPFYLWSVETGIFVVLGVILSFILWDFNSFRNHQKLVSFFLLFLFYLIASLHTYHINIFGSFFYFIPLLFYFICDDCWIYVYKKFLLIYTISLVPSLIVYFMVVWGDISLPHTIIPPLNPLKTHDYLAYPFLVVSDILLNYRFMGYFDEPGVIGTFSGTLLVINKCNLKDWKNWILLISGIVSFSLFFYLLVFIFVLLFGSLKSRLFLGVVIFVSVIFLLGTDNPFNDLIIQRLNIEESDDLSRLTRTDDYFDSFYSKFVKSDMLWYGYGNTYSETVANPSGASYKDLIVDFGIIMFMLYIVALMLYYLSFRLKPKQILFLLFLMSANIYQRPFIFSLAYIFLLVSPPVMLKMEKSQIFNPQ